MRGKALLILFFGLLFLVGCSNNKMPTAPNTNTQAQSNISTGYVNGVVVTTFANNVSKEDVEKFVSGLNLTPDIIYGFDGSGNNIVMINVPAGQEESWVELLRKYQVVQSAERLPMVTIFTNTAG